MFSSFFLELLPLAHSLFRSLAEFFFVRVLFLLFVLLVSVAFARAIVDAAAAGDESAYARALCLYERAEPFFSPLARLLAHQRFAFLKRAR